MNITELFKDAFNYSSSDWGKILILGLLVLGSIVLSFITALSVITFQPIMIAILGIITLIFTIVTYLIYGGYGLSVIKETIHNKNVYIDSRNRNLPEFVWAENVKDGLKVFILIIVYMLIPFILSLILGIFSGVVTMDPTWSSYDPSVGPYLTNYSNLIDSFGVSLAIGNVIISILSIVLMLFAIVAMGKLAETGRLSSIFEFSEILETISKIGWGNYIIWFILLYVITILIAFVAAMIVFIPIIGIIAYLLIIPAFLLIFNSRAIGLIYNESRTS